MLTSVECPEQQEPTGEGREQEPSTTATGPPSWHRTRVRVAETGSGSTSASRRTNAGRCGTRGNANVHTTRNC